MQKKIVLRVFSIIVFFFILLSILYFNFKEEKKIVSSEIIEEQKAKEELLELEEENYNSSNILKNVKYSAQDINGNLLKIEAKGGEIDSTNKNIIFLTDVRALVKLNNSKNIEIRSKFGKYNINNYDTIFQKCNN